MYVLVRDRSLVEESRGCDGALRHIEVSKANSLNVRVSECPGLRVFLDSMLKE
jgi:hypothetical protein